MKTYHKYLLVGITLLIGLALLPVVADAFAEEFGWERFAIAYQESRIFLPLISR